MTYKIKEQKHNVVIELKYHNKEKLNKETLISVINNLSHENIRIKYIREDSLWNLAIK